MKVGEKLRVKNKLGVMTIQVLEELNKDIGNKFGNLGDFKGLRVEFYQNDWLSLYGTNDYKTIYFIKIPTYQGEQVTTYKCEIVQDEVPEYDFVRYEVEE